jgi:cysteine synthase
MPEETEKARIDRLESVGAALIRANDFEAALNHYRALAQSIPSKNVFGDLVLVLQSKLRCERSLALANGGCP